MGCNLSQWLPQEPVDPVSDTSVGKIEQPLSIQVVASRLVNRRARIAYSTRMR
jgi:hypothetical protein